MTAPFIKGKNDWRFRDWFGALESGWLSESPGISKKRFAPTATCCSDSAFLLFWYPGKKTFPFPPSPSPKAKRTSSFTNSSKTNVSVFLTLAGRAWKAAKLPIEVELAGVPAIPETSEIGIKISLSRSNRKKTSLLLRLSASSDGVKEKERAPKLGRRFLRRGGRFFSFLPLPPLSWPLSLQ